MDKAGGGVLRWSGVLLLFGGVLLAMLSGNWSLGALVFGLGAVLLGLGHAWAAREAGRDERSMGWVLVLGGAIAMADAVIRMLFYG